MLVETTEQIKEFNAAATRAVEVAATLPLCWTVQDNDLIGGFIVTNYPHPLSEHDQRPVEAGGDHTKRGVIACECSSRGMAQIIADLLNHADDDRGTETILT
jgi:hypothetical protein